MKGRTFEEAERPRFRTSSVPLAFLMGSSFCHHIVTKHLPLVRKLLLSQLNCSRVA